MKKICLRLFALLMPLALPAQAQTLEECYQAAEQNYPLIRQYDLINRTADATVANLQTGWLPQISALAQASVQSDVAAWPSQMQTMLNQMGISLKGLKKDQYRVGIDINQAVYDGGTIKSQKQIARQQAEVQTAQNEVSLYQVRKRVNEMFFSLLFIDEQIGLNKDLQQLLEANEQKLSNMFKQGTASESDYNAVRAERLNAQQQLVSLQSQRRTLATLLSTFCGLEVENPTKPSIKEASELSLGEAGRSNLRPELKALDAQLRLTDARQQALDAALKPRLSLFATGYYGYPGFNMFEDMMSHQWSLNGMIGARLTWNIGALYTRKNDKAALDFQRQSIDVQRETFLFNNRLEQIQQNENVERYRQLMTGDSEIIDLRSKVRKAAESKLSHGIIDVNDLIKEINAENAAKVQQSVHEIEMLKEIYYLKYTTNK